jgi:predicted NBD/HSP70 family sugar kinase
VTQSYEVLTGERWTAAEIFDKPNRSEATQKTFDQYSQLCALALSTVINLIDPDIIVLGGGLSNTPGLCQAVEGQWATLFFQTRSQPALPAPGMVTPAAFEAQPGFGPRDLRVLESSGFFSG